MAVSTRPTETFALSRSGSTSNKKRVRGTRSNPSSCSLKASSRLSGSANSPKRARTKSPNPEFQSPPLAATTFGIEFEFTFAFHEDELKQVLTDYGIEGDIVKKLEPLRKHEHLLRDDDLSNSCRKIYPSWTLRVPFARDQSHPIREEEKSPGEWVDGAPTIYRRYLAEALLMVQRKLKDVKAEADVKALIQPKPELALRNHPEIYLSAQRANYDHWTLTNDHTIIGALESQLQEKLGHRMKPTTETRARDWDSTGVELISRKFEYAEKEAAFEEIGKYLGALQGRTWTSFGSVWCSTHVHIGFNGASTSEISLLHLQHIAYILALHEDQISACHPRSRSGLPVPDLNPPEPSTYPEEPSEIPDLDDEPPTYPENASKSQHLDNVRVLATEAQYTGTSNIASNARHLCQEFIQKPYPAQSHDIGSALFAADMTLPQLIARLQRPGSRADGNRYRGYIYNWNNLLALYNHEQSQTITSQHQASQQQQQWKPPKPTLEFRQHGPTLNAAEIQHWVTLLFAIVSFAQRKAEQSTRYGGVLPLDPGESPATREESKYPSAPQWPCRNIRAFCGEGGLGLEGEEVEYWVGRWEKYSDGRGQEGKGEKEGE